MQICQDNISAKVGGVLTPILGVQVTVTDMSTGKPAALYSDNGVTPLAQPLTTDETGYFGFYAANGRYSLAFSSPQIKLGPRVVQLYDPADDAPLTQQQAAAPSGASKLGYGQRTVENKLDEVVSVKDAPFNAKGDGSTDDTEAVNAAVAAAYAGGYALFWPAGTYVSNASIPNFHDVVHSGYGVIKRGAILYYITPATDAQVNQLEVAPSGNDANDGLDAANPLKTIQRPLDILQGSNALPKLARGTWKVHFAAGTYTEGGSWSKAGIAGNFVEFFGDVDGTNTPTTFIDGTSSSKTAGMYFDSGPSRLKITNISSNNFRSNSVASGIVVANKGIAVAYVKNCWAKNNLWAGVNADSIGQLLLETGTYDSNTNYNLRVRGGVEISIGYNGSATGNRVALKNCATAAQVRDASTGHFDWVDITNCPTGVWTTNVSRTTHTGLNFNTCNLAFRVDCSSTFNYDATTTFTGVTQRFTLSNSANDNGDGTGDGLCYNYSGNYWAVGMTKWGGSSIFSGASHAWCSDKTGTASFAYMVPAATDAQLVFGNTTATAPMYMTVKMASYQWRFMCNGTSGLFIDANSINAGRDFASTCGTAAARWRFLYSYDLSLKPSTSVVPTANGELTVEATSNTQLTFRLKGSDGVVRSATLTLA